MKHGIGSRAGSEFPDLSGKNILPSGPDSDKTFENKYSFTGYCRLLQPHQLPEVSDLSGIEMPPAAPLEKINPQTGKLDPPQA
jgi:hypothetical protein